MKKIFYFSFLTFIALALFSCVSPKITEPQECARELLADGIKNEKQLSAFFMSHNSDIDKTRIEEMAAIYIEECSAEGINSDAAFVQMCLETGFLRFGNLVTPDMNNFCGLGAMDIDHPGERFETVQLGIRAHVQHLQAYATDESVKLNRELVDPRYRWVHKAKYAGTIFELAGQWATDREYGVKLDKLLTELEDF